MTLPIVELIFEISQQLSRIAGITRFLLLNPESINPDVLHGLLFQIQMNFLVSHEYTHHVHRHCVQASALTQLHNELPIGRGYGGIDPQAQELDADGYAVMLVLAHLLRGERRTSALEALGQGGLPTLAGDEVLLLCFLLTAFAYFCSFWRAEASIISLYDLTHLPPPIRIKYVIEVAKMWCSVNDSLPTTWFDPARLQRLFSAAAEIIDATTKQTWRQQISVLRSREGDEYDGRLYARFEELRRDPNASGARIVEAPLSSPIPDVPT